MTKNICIVYLFFVWAPCVFAQDKNFLRARILSEGYLHNRESFAAFKCKFSYSAGWASTYEKAIKEDFKANTGKSFACAWFVKNDFEKYEKYEVLQDPKNNTEKTDEDAKNTTIALRSGQVNLVYAPSINAANIRPPGYAGRGHEITPFNMVIMGDSEFRSPHSCVKKALAGEFELKEISEKIVDGKKYYAMSVFDSKAKDSNILSMLIDPRSGYLPIEYRVHTSKNHLSAECKLLEYKKMEDGSCFPTSSRTLVYIKPGDPSSDIFVYSIKVLKLDVPGNTEPEDFYVDLPKGTEIANPSDLVGSFRLKENKRVFATELDKILNDTIKRSRAEKSRKQLRVFSEANSEVRHGVDSYQALLIGSVIMLAFGVGVFFWRPSIFGCGK